jgi:hypothetical protein
MNDDITNAFFGWIRGGGSGCLFAYRFSTDPASPDYWASSVVPGRQDYAQIATDIDAFFQGAIGKAEAAQVILPGISTPDDIVDLVNALCAMPSWTCSATEKDGHLLIGLRWLLPDDRHVNWVLGFADLTSMPVTRRSPYTALIVRLGAPGRAPAIALEKPNEANERQLDRNRIPVHLADMAVEWADDLIRRVWRGTQKKKAEKIEGDTMAGAAKAKVTFALPLGYRERLNCISDTLKLK